MGSVRVFDVIARVSPQSATRVGIRVADQSDHVQYLLLVLTPEVVVSTNAITGRRLNINVTFRRVAARGRGSEPI